jgi:hypothetical protein
MDLKPLPPELNELRNVIIFFKSRFLLLSS